MTVMDPDSFYESATDPTIRFARHPFSWRTFRQVDKYGNELGRYFVLSEDETTWTEYKKVEGISGIIPIDTPQEEIDAKIEKEAEERAERKRLYEARVASGEIDPLQIRRVTPSTISSDLVEVRPLPPPSGMLFYMDMIGGSPIIEAPSKPGKRNWVSAIKEIIKPKKNL